MFRTIKYFNLVIYIKSMGKHTLKCFLWKILWVLGFAALVIAFVEIIMQEPVLGFAPDLYLWTALILGVLAIPIKLDCADCTACKVGGGGVGGM